MHRKSGLIIWERSVSMLYLDTISLWPSIIVDDDFLLGRFCWHINNLNLHVCVGCRFFRSKDCAVSLSHNFGRQLCTSEQIWDHVSDTSIDNCPLQKNGALIPAVQDCLSCCPMECVPQEPLIVFLKTKAEISGNFQEWLPTSSQKIPYPLLVARMWTGCSFRLNVVANMAVHPMVPGLHPNVSLES